MNAAIVITDAVLREALLVARDHLDMETLRVSHGKDAALIESALASGGAAAPQAPAGWKTVPIRPTHEMLDAVRNAVRPGTVSEIAQTVWMEMVEVAPAVKESLTVAAPASSAPSRSGSRRLPMADHTNPGAPADPLAAIRAEIAYGPIGWATHHEPPMLFPVREEAALHCGDGEEPISLVPVESLTALLAQLEAAPREQAELLALLADARQELIGTHDFLKGGMSGSTAGFTIARIDAKLAAMAEKKEGGKHA